MFRLIELLQPFASREFQGFVPQFEIFQHIDEPHPPEAVGVRLAFQRVELWVAGICEERFRHFESGLPVAKVDPVPGQPFVVVGVVVDLVGQQEVAAHVCVIHPRGCLLMPCGILVAIEL